MTTLLTTSEAAEKLGVSRRRVEQLISTGQLQATRFGNVWQISKADVDAFVKKPVGNPNWRKPKPP